MKKLALALIATSALVFGLGTVASAQTYSPSLTVSPNPPALGGPFSVTFNNCTIGQTITLTQPQSTPSTVTATCAAVSGVVTGPGLGQATAQFTAAPATPGTYTITAVSSGGVTLTAGVTIPAQAATTTVAPATTVAPTTPSGGLPATGSDGISTTTGIAIGLLVVGLGLFVVAQVRRRQPHSA